MSTAHDAALLVTPAAAVTGQDLLAATARALSGCSDADEVLSRLAETVVPGLAQWCLVDRLDEPDMVTRVRALGEAGPIALRPDDGPVSARRSSAGTVGLLARLLQSPRGLLRLAAADIRTLAQSAEPRLRAQAELAIELGATDVLVVGLAARGQVLGVMTVGRGPAGFTDADVAALADLAQLAGLALDNARLLEAQRSVSAALQRSLLPPLPSLPELELAARYVPAGSEVQVGGDWYDVFVLARDRVGLVIGDATGHDVHAAAHMAELRHLLRAAALQGTGSPAVTLQGLDRLLAQLGSGASATCLYAQLLRPAPGRGWQLHWSNAGHLPPLLLHGGDGACFLDREPDLMLGVDEHAGRAGHRQDLAPGDVVLLFTDGLVEDRTSVLDDRLALLAVATTGVDRNPESLADRVIAQLPTGEDDIAVLVIRVGAAD